MHLLAARLAVALGVAGLVLDTAFTAAHRSLLSAAVWAEHGWPLIPLTTLGCALMGALVVRSSPRHPVGWLLLVASLTSVASPAEAYSLWVLEASGPGPDTAGHVSAWASRLLNAPLGLTALALVYLIAPDGRLRSPRWRWVVRAAVLGFTLYAASALLVSPTRYSVGSLDVGRAPRVLEGAGSLLIVGSLVASAVCLFLRLRQERGEPRRRLLWIASSAGLIACCLVLEIALSAARASGAPVASVLLFAAYLTMPVSVAVSVLRHRLFDIDVFVNRALVVLLATGLVATAYVLVVVVVGELLSSGGGFWTSLLATAAVALAFQPLRRSVVRTADRLAYGAAAAPYEALAELTRRLGAGAEPLTLLPALAESAGFAVGAGRVTARRRTSDGVDLESVWPPEGGPPLGTAVEVPVVQHGEVLGGLRVEMPAGRPARPAQLALLRALAASAAVPFRNARLAEDLAQQVDQLRRTTRELEGSRRRVLQARDVGRRRLERALAREVVPHLSDLPRRLERLAAGADAPDVEPLIESTTRGLDALRALTRGVYPAQLSRSGLPAALRSLAAGTGAGLEVDPSAVDRRYPALVEAAAYFCVAETARHLSAPVTVRLAAEPPLLHLLVTGRHHGVPPLWAVRDRVEAFGGTLAASASDGTATVEVRLDTTSARLVPDQPSGGVPAAVHAASTAAGDSSDFVR